MSKKSARATTIIYLLCILAFAGVLSLWITSSARAEEVVVESTPVGETMETTIPVVEPVEVVSVATSTDVATVSIDILATSTPEVQEVIEPIVEPVIETVIVANPEVVSEEANVATSTVNPPTDNPLVVSGEVSATTSIVIPPPPPPPPPPENPLVVSDEVSAKTLGDDPPNENPLVVSNEISATTSGGSDNPLVVSDEISAKTDGGGCTSNCGGGGGGGGGGRIVTPPVSCPLYLTKYIRLGYNNDPFEVRKLQKFLRDFEGFNQVQITGFYDLTTYNAVRVFQMRYGKDVLNPWGLDASDPTGFVFITTTYAINQIYCNRSTDNDFNLRHIYDEAPLVGNAYQPGEEAGGLIITDEPLGNIDTSTTSTTTATTTNKYGFFQTAAIGLINFLTNHPGVWLTILLFVALLILAYLILKLQEEGEIKTIESGDEWPEEVGLPSGTEVHQPIFPLIIAEEVKKGKEDQNKDFLEEVIMDESEEVPISELGELESDNDNGPESPRGRGRKKGK